MVAEIGKMLQFFGVFCLAKQENPISTASSCGLTKKGVERIHEMGLIVMKKRWVFCPAMQENPISTASSCGLTKEGVGRFDEKGVVRIDKK